VLVGRLRRLRATGVELDLDSDRGFTRLIRY
ncbi:uncharacterized protein METZ01_LOCUS388908, partial [marine metagenome]